MKPRNRIRCTGDSPTHGVVVHPGILFLAEVAKAVKLGPEAVRKIIEQNQVYLLGLTIEEGREIARITEVLRNIR
jgi:hypothetical protein